MNSIIARLKETQSRKLKFIQLDPSSVRIAVHANASFGNADNYASQIAFVMCLVDKHDRANVVHYGSQKCKRVTRSVMASELHALSYDFDQAFMVKTILDQVLDADIKIEGFIDSRTVFNAITKHGPTLEKRLQIDAYGLRQARLRAELASLAWIPSDQNIAGAMTKGMPSPHHAFNDVLERNYLKVRPTGWVELRTSHVPHAAQ